MALPFGFVGQTTNSPGAFADTGIGLSRKQTVTLASLGSQSVTLGTAAITGAGSSTFSLSNDSCSGATVAPGGTCSVDVTFAPTSASTNSGQVAFPANTYSGSSTFAVYGNGKQRPTAPSIVAIAGDDGIGLVVSPGAVTPGQASVTGFTVYRDDAPSTPLAQLAAGISAQYVDEPMSPGTSHTYTAVANSTLGDSVASTPVSATSLAPQATAGTANRFTLDIADVAAGATSYVEPAAVGTASIGAVAFTGSTPGHGLTAATALNGTRIAPGDYVTPNPVPQVTLNSSVNAVNCPTTALRVTDADFRADGTPDVFTATYVNDCGNGNTVAGAIQWHSTAALVAAGVTPATVDAGSVPVGQQGSAEDVTVTNTGSTGLLPTTASLGGTDASDFAIVTDGCAGQSLAPTATCVVSVRVAPSAAHARAATLVIPDNTPLGARRVLLHGTGVVAPTAPQGAWAAPRVGKIRVGWIAPFDNGGGTVTSYKIYRGASPDTIGSTPVAVVDGASQAWEDTGLAAGATYAYAVSAVNAAGESPTMPTAAATALTDELVFSTDLHGVGNYALVVGDASGSVTTTLLDDGHVNSAPAVSPDGTKVAFISNSGGTQHVWVMPLDGSQAPVQLTSTSGDDDFPSWSPDGTHIAYSHDNFGAWSVYTVTLAGATVAVPGGANADRPSYTPSGRELVVGSLTAPYGVDVIGLDGSGRRHVTGSDGGIDPQVSPDGSSIVMAVIESQATDQCQDSYPVTHIATIPYVGGVATTIASSGGRWQDDPAWWPEGDQISFDATELQGGCLGSSLIDTIGATGGLVSVRGGDSWGPALHAGTSTSRPVTPPPAPTGLGAALAHGAVTLHWSAPSANDVWKVVVRRSAANGAAPTTPGQGTQVYSGLATSVVAAGLTDGATYAFSVFAIDTSGTASPAGVWRATPMSPPKVTAPLVTSSTASRLPFSVSWGPVTGTPARYDVQYARQGGAAGTWLSATTARSGLFGNANRPTAVPAGSVWSISARARDAYGNLTAYGAATPAAVPFDDRWSGLHWSSGWRLTSLSNAFQGTLHQATTAGASVSATVTGRQFFLVGQKCATCGALRVYVDGVLKATVDTHGASTASRLTLWTSSLTATAAKHVVKVVVVGTSGRPTVVVDGLGVR